MQQFKVWLMILMTADAVRNVKETTRLLETSIQSDIILNLSTKSPSLFPVDTIAYIAQFCGEKQTINSLMRTSKSNLQGCQIFIDRNLFSHLINHGICKKEIMKIPLIEPIKINAQKMPYYFINHTSSDKYIGIDTQTNLAFISFCLRKLSASGSGSRNKHSQKTITIVFRNHGNKSVYKIFLADRWRLPYYYTLPSLWYKQSNTTDIEAINHLLKNKKIITNILFDDKSIWCLNNQWESVTYWLAVQDMTKFTCKQCAKIVLMLGFVYGMLCLVSLVN